MWIPYIFKNSLHHLVSFALHGWLELRENQQKEPWLIQECQHFPRQIAFHQGVLIKFEVLHNLFGLIVAKELSRSYKNVIKSSTFNTYKASPRWVVFVSCMKMVTCHIHHTPSQIFEEHTFRYQDPFMPLLSNGRRVASATNTSTSSCAVKNNFIGNQLISLELHQAWSILYQ